jgi:spore germination protein YaaH
LPLPRHIQVLRSDDGSLNYSFIDERGRRNEVWFDDGRSIASRLAVLDPKVGSEVGVLYYGLGGEDPKLWSTLQGLSK